MEALAAAFAATTSPDPAPRKAAEDFLQRAATQPGFCLLALQLSAAAGAEEHVRLAAALAFKNHLKFHWAPALPDEAGAPQPLTVGGVEKEQVKGALVAVALAQPARIQAQLSEALALVAASDFPDSWPALLPELVARLPSHDPAVVNGVLTIADTIFRRFCEQYTTVEVVKDIKYVLSLLAAPLLELLVATGARLAGPEGSVGASAHALLTTVLLICRIFYSLNYQELPEVFEDNMAAWMTEFKKYLAYNNPAVVENDPSKENVIDQVKAAICLNVNLYLEKNEEEFAPYLRDFATAIWGQLMQVGLEPSKDALATESIRFLTTLVNGVHYTLFQDAETLQNICKDIIIPNLRFRDADEELFSDNYVEYIRRDMEGSDTDTRRRMACELLKALTGKFQSTVTAAVSGYVGSLLAEHAAAPEAAWKQKDCAIYLVIALTVRGKTGAMGATATNELVNIGDFFTAHVVPELQAPPMRGSPVLKADALKFLTTFRAQLSKPACLAMLPSLVALMCAENNVVHSYAALAVERMLLVRDGGVPRFSSSDLLPLREALLGGLFGALTLPESRENDYVMKALVRVLSVLGPDSRPVAASCAERLAATMLELARNPRNPLFSHYLFEAVAVLVRHSADSPDAAPRLEALLFPPFQEILQADLVDFSAYVFQVMAQLVELRPAPLPPQYLALFPPLLSPELWRRPGNVPALVRLLQAYLARAPAEVVAAGHLQGVLGVFQKLNASKAHDHEGFFILNALVEFLPPPAWAEHLPTVWSLLLQRLQSSRTQKYTRSFTVFLALLLAKQGPAWVAAGLDGVQAGLFAMLVEQVWLTGLAAVAGDTERKLAAVAATKLLTEFPPLASDAAAVLWGRLLEAAVVLLVDEAEEAQPGDAEEEEGRLPTAAAGGTPAFARLASAARPETQPVPEVRDARKFLAASIARMAAAQPGRLAPRIAAMLGQASQAALAQMCVEAGVAVV